MRDLAVSAYWIRVRVGTLKRRAAKLLSGVALSPKESARILRDSAFELERISRAWDDMEQRLALAEAWRAGHDAAMAAKEKK